MKKPLIGGLSVLLVIIMALTLGSGIHFPFHIAPATYTAFLQKSTIQTLSEGQQWLLKTDEISICAIPIPIGKHLFYHDLKVFLSKQVLFSDTNSIFTTNKDRLPIVRKLAEQRYEILLGIMETHRQQRILQLLSSNDKIYFIDTLPMIAPTNKDYDNTGESKFGGFWFQQDIYCQLCDSTYYNPFLIYEMRPDGFWLDTLATRQWIMQHYNNFYGYKPSHPIVVPQKETNFDIDT